MAIPNWCKAMNKKEELVVPKNAPKPIPVYDEIDEFEDIDPFMEADLEYIHNDWSERD